jgi:hypothetical protein
VPEAKRNVSVSPPPTSACDKSTGLQALLGRGAHRKDLLHAGQDSARRGEPCPLEGAHSRRAGDRGEGLLSGACRGRRQGPSRLQVTLPLLTRWEHQRRPNRQTRTLPFPRAIA